MKFANLNINQLKAIKRSSFVLTKHKQKNEIWKEN